MQLKPVNSAEFRANFLNMSYWSMFLLGMRTKSYVMNIRDNNTMFKDFMDKEFERLAKNPPKSADAALETKNLIDNFAN